MVSFVRALLYLKTTLEKKSQKKTKKKIAKKNTKCHIGIARGR